MRLPIVVPFALVVCLSFSAPAAAECYKCSKPWYGGKYWICAETSSGWKYCQITYGPSGNQCSAWDECGGPGWPGAEVPDGRLDERCPGQERLFLMYAEAGREAAPELRLVAAETPSSRSGS
jgi:hypothetical protein